jgi:hypothetical protein
LGWISYCFYGSPIFNYTAFLCDCNEEVSVSWRDELITHREKISAVKDYLQKHPSTIGELWQGLEQKYIIKNKSELEEIINSLRRSGEIFVDESERYRVAL